MKHRIKLILCIAKKWMWLTAPHHIFSTFSKSYLSDCVENVMSRIQGWAKVGLQLWVHKTQNLHLHYYLLIIIFHLNSCKLTFAPPSAFQHLSLKYTAFLLTAGNAVIKTTTIIKIIWLLMNLILHYCNAIGNICLSLYSINLVSYMFIWVKCLNFIHVSISIIGYELPEIQDYVGSQPAFCFLGTDTHGSFDHRDVVLSDLISLVRPNC